MSIVARSSFSDKSLKFMSEDPDVGALDPEPLGHPSIYTQSIHEYDIKQDRAMSSIRMSQILES